MKNNNISVFKNKNKIICLTAYSFNFARIIDGLVDLILVGDSMGMVLYGMDNTRQISDDVMIRHARAVKKGTKKSIVFFDLPYEKKFNENNIVKRVVKIIKETECDGVKIEGNSELVGVIKKLKRKKIPVMAHLGLQPQKFSSSKKFKIYGRKHGDLAKIIKDAEALQDAGAISILLEGVISSVAKKVTSKLSIPTIGIGASKYCDGQILVSEDMLGFFSEYYPKFVKKYIDLSKVIKKTVKKYSNEVKRNKFPTSNYHYD